MESMIHKRHRVKLVKDMKSDNEKLRQSLIDIDEVQNLDKIYATMKKTLTIDPKNMNVEVYYKQESPPKMQMPIQEKILLYKKQQHQKKLNNKLKMFKAQTPKKKIQLKQSSIFQIITSFDQHKKRDHSSSYLRDLKQSQRELTFIKSNTKRSRIFKSHTPENFNRKKVISLETGLPKTLNIKYSTLQQCLKRVKPRQTRRKASLMEEFKQFESGINQIYSVRDQNIESKSKLTTNENQNYMNSKLRELKLHKKVKNNVDKSVKVSQDMINTLTSYIDTKRQKRTQYNNLIETWNVDKVITSEIRRKNYKLLGEQNEKKIETYRYLSQKQRNEIIKTHYNFYTNLLKFIVNQIKPGQQLSFTKYLCEEIRKKLELNNRISESDIYEIILAAKKQQSNIKFDDLSQRVLQKIGELLKMNIDFSLELN